VPDVVVTNPEPATVSVLINSGTGALAAPAAYSTDLSPSSLAVADLRGTGHPDLVMSMNGYDKVGVMQNRGDGTFAAVVEYQTGSGTGPVQIADVTDDGHLDLVIPNNADAAASPTR
jgi:hypothetical protein